MDRSKIYIPSISSFGNPVNEIISMKNPKTAKTKGSWQDGHPPKHSKRFISRFELLVPWTRVCSLCDNGGHNKRSCPNMKDCELPCTGPEIWV